MCMYPSWVFPVTRVFYKYVALYFPNTCVLERSLIDVGTASSGTIFFWSWSVPQWRKDTQIWKSAHSVGIVFADFFFLPLFTSADVLTHGYVLMEIFTGEIPRSERASERVRAHGKSCIFLSYLAACFILERRSIL